MIILFVTSVMTMMTVESAFNVIWRVRKSRPFAQRVLVYWAIITLGPILFGVSLSMSSYLFAQSIAFAGSHNLMPPVIEWALASATLPFTMLAFTMLYVFLPNCRVEWRDALVGGLVAAIAFELAKRGFGYYVRRIPTYTAVYGAFAALPVFLLWVYLCWMITLIGAMLTSALPASGSASFIEMIFRGAICSMPSNCSLALRRHVKPACRVTPASSLHGCCAVTWIPPCAWFASSTLWNGLRGWRTFGCRAMC
jgi:membrane protein